jgi:hypothetical protein
MPTSSRVASCLLRCSAHVPCTIFTEPARTRRQSGYARHSCRRSTWYTECVAHTGRCAKQSSIVRPDQGNHATSSSVTETSPTPATLIQSTCASGRRSVQSIKSNPPRCWCEGPSRRHVRRLLLSPKTSPTLPPELAASALSFAFARRDRFHDGVAQLSRFITRAARWNRRNQGDANGLFLYSSPCDAHVRAQYTTACTVY